MPLHHPQSLHERILSFGGWGQGKSYDWLSIAKLAHQTHSPGKFYAIDTDMAVGHMLATEFPGLAVEEGGNVVNMPVFDWKDLVARTDEAGRKIGTDDWMVVDLISPTWDWVQEYFTSQVFHKGIDEYFLEARKLDKNSKGGGFEGWKDWPVINRLYRSFTQKVIRHAGHTYCTAAVDVINTDTDSRETKTVFGPYGVKPKGQKHTPHFFHSVLWKNSVKAEQWRVTTIKDRGRRILTGEEVNNFATGYLMRVAGWKL